MKSPVTIESVQKFITKWGHNFIVTEQEFLVAKAVVGDDATPAKVAKAVTILW